MNLLLKILGNLVLITILGDRSSAPVSAAEIEADFLMFREPAESVLEVEWTISPELVPLWRKVLKGPESELQRQAAEAIVAAHKLGHPGMEAAVPELISVLTSSTSHPLARYAAAHALIVLDHRDAATKLFEVSQRDGKDMRLLVEPALARWKFDPIRFEWHHRIANLMTPRRDLILAINGFAQEHDSAAIDDLLTLALPAEKPADIRLAAARAAGLVATSGLENAASQLLARRSRLALEHLCASSLLSQHRSAEALKIQQDLALDPEPTVAATALRSLFHQDPRLVVPLVEQVLPNRDANVRRVAIETYVDQPTPEHMRRLAPLMNDPHPELRTLVRKSFERLSKQPELDSAIRESSVLVLEGDDWRGQEQAAILLGALDHEGVANRLIVLLESQRPEVKIAVAWSLKAIAVPETAAPVVEFASTHSEDPAGASLPLSYQFAHLFEMLGKFKYVEAVPLLEKYVPKSPVRGEHARAAAVWALGLIFEDQSNEPLAAQLMERIRDIGPPTPEFPEVRRTSALTIGRLSGNSQLAGLKEMIGPTVDNDRIELAFRWAILRISGEAMPLPKLPTSERKGWFLEPLTPDRN